MTVNDPRPQLAAMPAARLAPAAEALTTAHVEDHRACADYHRAGRAARSAKSKRPQRASMTHHDIS